MVEEFWDEDNAGFFFTGTSHEKLIVRSKDYFDNATPSGNSVAASVLLRLGILTDSEHFRNLAVSVFREVADSIRKYPSGFGYALSGLDFLLSTPKEVAIIAPEQSSLKTFVRAAWDRYLPNKVVASALSGDSAAIGSVVLLQNRNVVEGKTAAYVCQNYTCKEPVTEIAAFAEQLSE